jgi:phosphatidylglycerol---prolipoprotein diacylglyceryl transferase
MKPVLFTISTFNVYAFGFFLFLAFLFSTYILYQLAKREFKEEEYFDSFFYTSIVGLICARVGFILMHFDVFGTNILRYILVRETPGLSILTGLFGSVIFFFIYGRKHKFDFLHVLDIFSIVSAFALSLIKIGQLLGGAGFGAETKFFLAVSIIGKTGRFHPVELYEAIAFFVLFVILYTLYPHTERKKWPSGFISCWYGIFVMFTVFLLEFLKSHSVYLYGLSLRQIIALVLFLILLKPTITRMIKVIQLRRKKE